MSAPASMSPAVATPGPSFFSTMRLMPSACWRSAISLMLRTMSVTSSRTPGIEENSCSTPSICTDVMAAPCSDDSSTRRSALPSVSPKPRSSGSATTVAKRCGSRPEIDVELGGLNEILPVLLQHRWALSWSLSGAACPSFARILVQHVRCLAFLLRRAGACAAGSHCAGSASRRGSMMMVKPAACSARSADSRPDPGPLTSISRFFMPCSIAFLPASSAATCAA